MLGVWNRRLGLFGPLPNPRAVSAVSVQQLLLPGLRRPHDPVSTAARGVSRTFRRGGSGPHQIA